MGRQLPEGWREVRLGDVSSIHDGTHQTPKYVEEGIPFYSVENVTNNNFTNTKFIRRQVFEEECKHVKLEKGDILMTRIGDIGTSKYVSWKVEASFYVSLALIKTKYPLDSHFLHFYISGNDFKKELWKRTIHVAFPRKINLGEIGHCVVQFPPLPEQKAIANTLQTWDEAIEKTEALIAAKEKRFKWLVSTLIVHSGYKRTNISAFAKEVSVRNQNGDIDRVLSVTNHSGFVLPENQFERRIASADLSQYKVVKHGQYAYNPSRINVGSIARLDDWDNGVLSPMYITFKLNAQVESDYFLHWLSSGEARHRIRQSAQGSVRETVSFSGLSAISVALPNLQTQKRIAYILNTARREIDILKQLANCYHTQKRGLMQKLLTGEWRLPLSFPRTRESRHSRPEPRLETKHPYPEPRPKDYHE